MNLKKLIFFIPAIIFTLLYGFFALGGISAIHPIAIAWLLFLWVAGVLLSKARFWGGFFGIIPAICFIYMGTQDTGQIISETPIGIIFFLFYAICIYCVYRKNKIKADK